MQQSLLIVGAGFVLAALVGGGFKGFGFEVPVIGSTKRQIAIALFGLFLMFVSWLSDRPVRNSPPAPSPVVKTTIEKTTIEKTTIEIVSPAPNQSVKLHQYVRGKAPPGTKRVWLIVHPLETNDCWAQGPGIVDADGTWRIMAQFGEDGNQHAGKLYELRAATTDMPLEAGLVSCGLDAVYSRAVDVVRI